MFVTSPSAILNFSEIEHHSVFPVHASSRSMVIGFNLDPIGGSSSSSSMVMGKSRLLPGGGGGGVGVL